jgi:hypothetical protein
VAIASTFNLSLIRLAADMGTDKSWGRDDNLGFRRIGTESHATEQVGQNIKRFLQPVWVGGHNASIIGVEEGRPVL